MNAQLKVDLQQLVLFHLALIFLLKVTAFILGYLAVRLGYQLISQGVRGEFKFTHKAVGVRADLANISPGLLFVLLGVFLIGYGVHVKKVADIDGGGERWIAARPSTGNLTATLTADPTTVQKGNSVTLHWSAQNAEDLDLEPGVGKVQAIGSVSVTPQESTTYTLTATGPTGTENSAAYVRVSNPVTPSINPPHNNPPRPNSPDLGQKERGKTGTTRREEPPVVVPQPVRGPAPKEVRAAVTLGDFHRGRGEYNDAITYYQKGLQLEPSNAELRQKLDEATKACKKENAILGESFNCGSN